MFLPWSVGVIECISVSAEGALLCTVGDDQAMKVFDVVNFDMINMLKLGYEFFFQSPNNKKKSFLAGQIFNINIFQCWEWSTYSTEHVRWHEILPQSLYITRREPPKMF